MKKIIITFVVGLLAPQIVQAQGTLTYLSNLGQSSTGSDAVGSDSWLAIDFFTGTNAGGYVLNSVQLAMTDASGNPSGFTVMIYTDAGFGPPSGPRAIPGSSLGSLSGSSDPETSGIYTYTDGSNIILLPNFSYFIVLTAGTAVANGAYEWSLAGTSSYNPSGRWATSVFDTSSSGSSWTSISSTYPQFTINATPVPEPDFLSLFGLGGLFFLWHRRKVKAA
jgi:hypothetical protein